MKASDLPSSFPIPWADAATAPFIRTIPQVPSGQPGAASLQQGFPTDTFSPVGAGGTPPFGADANGILNQITAWSQWQKAGGPIAYDSVFSAAIGGYPNGALIAASIPGNFWYNTVDDNTSNPDAGGAGWITPPGMLSAGSAIFRFGNDVVPTAVLANGQTLGNAASGATSASANNLFVFKYLWDNFPNSQCPVSGGRGANAIADFNAGKQITTLDCRGSGIQGVDTMGGGASTLLSGVPVVFGARTTPGSVLGENLHTLVVNELASHFHAAFINFIDPTHIHTNSRPNVINTGSGTDTALWGASLNGSTAAASTGITVQVRSASGGGGTLNQTDVQGGGQSHNTVQRSMLVNIWLKQ